MVRNALLLPFVVGCGYSTLYPRFGGLDTGAPGQGFQEPDAIPCGEDGPPGELWVQLEDWYGGVVSVYEIAPSTCEEVQITALAPGQAWSGPVLTGHTWVIRSTEGAYVTHFQVPLGAVEHTEYVP